MFVDTFNRVHDYLRISLTDKCNLRCFYCMPEENYRFAPAQHLMQADEIEALAGIFVENGIKKIRITGGEPLARKDAKDIIRRLLNFPVELALTTNATMLHSFIDVLDEARFSSLNISLDTLRPDRYLLMTRRDLFGQVKSNIDMVMSKGFRVKVNMVVTRGVNDDEINDFVQWTQTDPVEVRFIEFMPFSGNHWEHHKVFTLKEILDTIAEKYDVVKLEDDLHDTAKHFSIPGSRGRFAVISTMSAPFCSGCNRIRLTADGKIKNCLFSNGEIDLLKALRNGDDVVTLIHQSIRGKAKELGGQFTPDTDKVDAEKIRNRSMIAIGG